MGRIVIIATVLACAAFYFAFTEYRMSTESKPTPQHITCATLAREGYGDNANVIVTDFIPSSGSYVYEASTSGGNWNHVFIPLLPSGNADARDFKVILSTTEYHSEAELRGILQIAEIHGLITNKISSLGSKEKDLLAGSYPGVDFSKVWILQQNREPHGMGFVVAIAAGGVLLLLPGAFALMKRRG